MAWFTSRSGLLNKSSVGELSYAPVQNNEHLSEVEHKIYNESSLMVEEMLAQNLKLTSMATMCVLPDQLLCS